MVREAKGQLQGISSTLQVIRNFSHIRRRTSTWAACLSSHGKQTSTRWRNSGSQEPSISSMAQMDTCSQLNL